MAKITVQNTNVTIISINENDYISLTDIAKHKSEDPAAVIGNWMRNRNTIEYLGIWESLYNSQFNPLEFEGFKREAGLNAFLRKSGQMPPMPLVLYLNPEDTVELMPIKILRLSLQVGFQLSLNYILSKNSKGLNKKNRN